MRQRRDKGSGSVSQRKDGTWTARVVIGNSSDGTQKVKAFYGKTESEVKKKMREFQRDLIKNDSVVVSKTTVASLFQDWLRDVKINELKPCSYDRLEQTVNIQIIPNIGMIQLHNIRADDIQGLINTLRSNGKSYSTIKKAYNAMTDCFRNAAVTKKMTFNPTDGVVMPRRDMFDEGDIKYYNREESAALCNAATARWSNGELKYRLGYCIPILLNTGLRAAELAGLHWSDVDFDRREIRVVHTRVVVKDRSGSGASYKTITQKSAKTSSGIRTIPLNQCAMEAFRNMQNITGKSEYVFATSDMKPMSISYLGRLVDMVAAAAGFPPEKRYGPHALRHTFASLLFENNMPIEMISMLMGHKDVTTTERIYIHIFNVDKKRIAAVESLENIF